MAPKRKRSVQAGSAAVPSVEALPPPAPKRRASARAIATSSTVNPDVNSDVIDAPNATRASPDSDVNDDVIPGPIKPEVEKEPESPLSDVPDVVKPPAKKGKAKKAKAEENEEAAVVQTPAKKPRGKKAVKEEPVEQEHGQTAKAAPAKKVKKDPDAEPTDPEADGDEQPDEEELKEALGRPPPVNTDYMPLPWKGRLGYACLNTYLRNSNPPVFSSRTCRIQSILEHRHPLQDPSQPEHSTKNRPDKNKPADVALGQRYVEALGLANVKDMEKMLRWNHRYNIKFFRLSSEMFPFASHPEYGYKLAPFASEALAEAGRVVAELGHRVTTHPGQFTQLGSPRQSVIDNAVRDLNYHDEMLSLLKLPEQQNRDAVMILHMGGVFEGKEETLARFRKEYATLSQSVKNRIVLENDDVSWTVHDLLPVCEELNIPMVLDFHHHNIMFDSNQIREGTKDIMELFPRIKATWDRKNIRQKMHYSEPTPPAITGRQRRKHNPRVFSLPSCVQDMDLMIEAKDKEQAVFELMRNFRLPGHDTFTDVLPYMRNDDNKVAIATANKKKKGNDEPEPVMIPEEDVGMGGPEGRVYWPMGMEEWLRPKKREVKKKDPEEAKEKLKKQALELYNAREAEKAAAKNGVASPSADEESDLEATPATKKAKAAMKKKSKVDAEKAAIKLAAAEVKAATAAAKPKKEKAPATKKTKVKQEQAVPTPSSSDIDEDLELDDAEDEGVAIPAVKPAASRQTGRRKARVSYEEEDEE